MSFTAERRTPGAAQSIEDRVLDLLHQYPYEVLRNYVTDSSRVLEVGFGEGYGAGKIHGIAGEYHGLDISREAVHHASRKYGNDNTRFHWFEGFEFPFPDERFDLVIAFHVIEHVKDTSLFVREMLRTCSRGGVVMVVTPNRNYRLRPGERPWNRFHETEFDPKTFQRLCDQYSHDVKMFGITGSPAMNMVERKRAARAQHFARLDILQVRRLLPERLLFPIKKALLAVRIKSKVWVDQSQLQLACVSHSEDLLTDALFLMAIMHKK